MFRRTPVQQVIQIVLVAVTLVIILMFKDQCGRGFGQLLDSVAPPPSKSPVQQGR
jgi:hypothetical protein